MLVREGIYAYIHRMLSTAEISFQNPVAQQLLEQISSSVYQSLYLFRILYVRSLAHSDDGKDIFDEKKKQKKKQIFGRSET